MQAFDQLVMPSKRKRLIKALVDSNQGRASGFDDFIKGKGMSAGVQTMRKTAIDYHAQAKD